MQTEPPELSYQLEPNLLAYYVGDDNSGVESLRDIIIDFPSLGITYNGGWCSATRTR